MRRCIAVIGAGLLAGCAQSSSMPLAADMVAITASTAPICGAAGVQEIAARRAAVETINKGFDRFIIVDGAYQAQPKLVGYDPMRVNTTYNYWGSTSTVTGGEPIIMNDHNHRLVVKMFKEGDPAGANAISAREHLGSDWHKIVQQKTMTCMQ